MTHLQDLISSLITVIIRYHDSQSFVEQNIVVESRPEFARIKSRELAIKLQNLSDKDRNEFLNNFITACTKGYEGRKPFLDYLLSEIQLLHSLSFRSKPYSLVEFSQVEMQIGRMFSNIKKLLSVKKGTDCNILLGVTPNQPLSSSREISLTGLQSNQTTNLYMMFTTVYCNSGNLLIEEIMNRFNVSLNLGIDDTKTIATSLCVEHQNDLLVPEQKKEITCLQSKLIEKEQQLSEFEKKLNQCLSEKLALESENQGILPLKEENTLLKEQNTLHIKSIEKLQAELTDALKNIELLKKNELIQKKMLQNFRSTPLSFYSGHLFSFNKLPMSKSGSPEEERSDSPIYNGN